MSGLWWLALANLLVLSHFGAVAMFAERVPDKIAWAVTCALSLASLLIWVGIAIAAWLA